VKITWKSEEKTCGFLQVKKSESNLQRQSNATCKLPLHGLDFFNDQRRFFSDEKTFFRHQQDLISQSADLPMPLLNYCGRTSPVPGGLQTWVSR
jgi:hypothetical protein